jgi:uncharacterized protein (DUF2267 family)
VSDAVAVDPEGLFATVERQAGLDREGAERAVQATLETLSERLSRGESRKLADRLPLELSPWILTGEPPELLDVDEFLRRVAEREGVDLETAERHARSVFSVLREALPEDLVADLVATLPDDFRPLVLGLEVPTLGEILRGVRDRTGHDDQLARLATEAVLETLAEQLPPGEVRDLRARLPVQLHPPLERGATRSGGRTTPMAADEFVRRVARRAQVPSDRVRSSIRAVLATLRHVSPDEFADVLAGLPPDDTSLLPSPSATRG